MKKLVLVRHGKSSWEEEVSDKHRALTKRGIKDANLVSGEFRKYLPDNFIVWSSTAVRAGNTAVVFVKNIAYPVNEIVFKDELYTFNVNQLAEVIRSAKINHDCIILFAHNSAITDFVNKFGDVFIENVPTAGLVEIEFEADSWKDIKNGKTKLTLFPKDLKESK